MSNILSIDDMLTRYPGTTRGAWAQHRYMGTGPAFLKIGRKIFYREEDVLAWEDNMAATKTGQAA